MISSSREIDRSAKGFVSNRRRERERERHVAHYHTNRVRFANSAHAFDTFTEPIINESRDEVPRNLPGIVRQMEAREARRPIERIVNRSATYARVPMTFDRRSDLRNVKSPSCPRFLNEARILKS